ncbi:ASCH domain-containing protein [soil metagenome]
MANDIDRFWAEAAAATHVGGAPPTTWAFGDSPEMADRLLALVLDGSKTATAGAFWHHETGGEPVPVVGELSIVLDGVGAPRCLLRTTEVLIVPFDAVDADFARDEGAGDRTLGWWRAVHEAYFRRTLPAVGREFTPDMPIVCERFELLYPQPA